MNINWTGRPCCTAHINAGVPGGCHVLPKDAIRLALDERAHGFNKALEQHYAAKKSGR